MCGIVGYLGPHSHVRERAFLDLLRLDVVRGPHSTGVAFCDKNGNLDIVKMPILPDDLLDTAQFKKANKAAHDCYIGHNRWATIGKVNRTNAHPFEHGDIVGVHNGTLTGKWRLTDGIDFEVDSEALIYNIALEGIEKTWENTDGAAALVWWDSSDGTLNMLRNDERPMYYAYINTKDTNLLPGLFWASESWMLPAAAVRNDVKIGKPKELPVNTHFKFNYIDSDKDTMIELERKKLTPFVEWVPKVVQGSLVKSGTNGSANKKSSNSAESHTATRREGDKSPTLGQEVNLIPINLTRTISNPGGKVLETMVHCNIQNYPGAKADLRIVKGDDNEKLAELVPNIKSTYDKIIFVGQLQTSWKDTETGQWMYGVNPREIDIIVPSDARVREPNGTLLNEGQFNEQYDNCGWCGDPLLFGDLGQMVFGKKTGLCSSCVDSLDDETLKEVQQNSAWLL